MSPVPAPKIMADLSFDPTSPFRLLRTWPTQVDLEEEEIDEAINMFVRYGVPPMNGVVTQLLDADGVIVAGVSKHDGEVTWVILDCAYNLLAEHPLVDKLLLLDIERVRTA